MGPGDSISFSELLSQKSWDDYGSFITEAPEYYVSRLEDDLKQESEIKTRIRVQILEKHFKIKQYTPYLREAEKLLFEGRVVGIDGTVSKLRTLSGLRCQIGVVAVNYFNDKIRQAYFISEASLAEKTDDIIEVLKNRERKNRIISDMVVRALMLYREREVGLRSEFSEFFKMMHGPLLPFELMTGLGRLRALESTLDVLERLIDDERCFSVISSSTQDDYMTLGSALEPGEYVVDPSSNFGDELSLNEDFMAQSKWRESELERVTEFFTKYATKILVGIIKVSQRPYIFHAHRNHFDQVAGIIARDALLQKEKGFPLLIDYADTLCSGYFPAGDFNSLLAYRLAKSGSFLAETSERELRMK